MKIDCNQILLPQIRSDSGARANVGSKQPSQVAGDEVRLMNQEQLRSLLGDQGTDSEVDSKHLMEISATMTDGTYQVPAEQVADAILDEADCLKEILK